MRVPLTTRDHDSRIGLLIPRNIIVPNPGHIVRTIYTPKVTLHKETEAVRRTGHTLPPQLGNFRRAAAVVKSQ
jgi:hypothetical protein